MIKKFISWGHLESRPSICIQNSEKLAMASRVHEFIINIRCQRQKNQGESYGFGYLLFISHALISSLFNQVLTTCAPHKSSDKANLFICFLVQFVLFVKSYNFNLGGPINAKLKGNISQPIKD